ncbi:MAG: DUF1338 domain-containing protein [Bdellovibrionaceae bacterium]|nr:DUF1338 domain-containing protein [Pseudobdellovibrionaceae bacterium]
MSLENLMTKMWADYIDFNPQAKRVYDLLRAEGEVVINDHIALRTFQHPKLGIEALASHFLKYGYSYAGEYHFESKKLYARHYEHTNPNLPKIFISELELHKLSPFARDTALALIEQVPEEKVRHEEFLYSGRPWTLSYSTYEKLAEESEYASWLAAHGYRPNHFTVSVNALKKFNNIRDLNKFLKNNGFKLNTSGGEVKGTPEELLEQSSTMAELHEVEFTDGRHRIPACYYEFAKRYPQKDGRLYQGFIAKSADKIFESTNRA